MDEDSVARDAPDREAGAALNAHPRIPTGFSGLDALLGGGLPAGGTVLVLADPTNAPYRFLERFAATGLQAGQPTLYYSLERPREEVVHRILHEPGLPPEPPALRFVDCYSQRLRALDEDVLGRIGVTNHSPRLPEKLVPDLVGLPHDAEFRLVVESLSEAIDVYGLEAALGLLNHASAVVRRTRGAALFLLVRGEHAPSVETRARHLADGVLEFGLHHQGLGVTPYLLVTKMPDGDDEARVFPYRNTAGGLFFESTRRIP